MGNPDAMISAAEELAQLIEIAAGHRARALEAGFSPIIAETMALHIHEFLVAQLTKAAG